MIAKNKFKKIWLAALALIWLLPIKALALIKITKPLERFKNLADKSGYNINTANTKQSVIIDVILYALGFVGIFFLMMIIYSGWQWMSAGGNQEIVTQAKGRMKNAILGFAVIMIAYAVTILVNKILNASLNNSLF